MSRLIVSQGGFVAPNYRTTYWVKDDFSSSIASNGTVGELGWAGSNGTITNLAATGTGHPGVIHLDTGATQNTICNIEIDTVGTGMIWSAELFDITFVVRVNETDSQIRLGMMGAGSSDPSANGVFFEKLQADTSWFGVSRKGGVQTRSSTSATSTNWVTLRLRRLSSTTTGFSVDGAAEVTDSGTNADVAAAVQPFVQIKNTAAAASRTMDVDYFEMMISGLSRT